MDKLEVINERVDLTDFDIVPLPEDGYPENGYYDQGSQSESKYLLRLVLSTLVGHWFLILSVVTLITGAVVVYVAQESDRYRASARVQVNSEISPQLKSASVVVRNGNDPEYYTTQLEILQSSALMRKAVIALDLENNEDFLDPQRNNNRGVIQNVMRMFGMDNVPDLAEEVEVAEKPKALSLETKVARDPNEEAEKLSPYVDMLLDGLRIDEVEKTRLIEIEFRHENPEIAAKVANTIADAYVLQNLEQKVQTNLSAGDFLTKRVAELQSEIRRDEERLINYARKNSIVSLDSEQNTVVKRLSSLNVELGTAENERLKAQTSLQAAKQNQLWKTDVANESPQVTSLQNKLSDLNQKLTQLRTEYTESWPEVVQVKKQIANIESQLKKQINSISSTKEAALQQRFNEAVAKEKALRAQFNTQRSEVINQNEAAINYKIIQQEITTNKSLLDGLLQRSKENEVVVAGTRNNVLVLDRATEPLYPYGPRRFQSVLLALLLSGAFGIGLAFVSDWLNDTITLADDPEALLGIPLLGGIPLARGSLPERVLPKRFLLRRQNRKVERNYSGELFEGPMFQESYLQLVTHLLFSRPGGPPKTILVTSAETGEGKTVSAVNIAAGLAKTRKKTLLIDCDLRCPRIQYIKSVDDEVGLTHLLVSEKVTESQIDDSIFEDETSGIDILFAGGTSPNPAGLLSGYEMRQLLDRLSNRYDHIVIDSPPVLQFADSLLLAKFVDSVVLVARDGYSSRHAINKAKRLIQQIGGTIAGLVLNGIPARTPYYYGYLQKNNDADKKLKPSDEPLSLDL